MKMKMKMNKKTVRGQCDCKLWQTSGIKGH